MKRVPTDIFLELSGPDLVRATAVASEFRGPVRNLWLGQSLCLSHGPEALRALDLLGLFRVVCDARLRGGADEVASGVGAISRLDAVWGVTVSADDQRVVEAAQAAADRAYEDGLTSARVRLIGSIDPLPTCNDAWASGRRSFESYERFVTAAADRCRKAGFYGIHVRPADAGLIGPGLRVFARSEAAPQPFVIRRGANRRKLDTPLDLLAKGIHHPMLDPLKVGCGDMEAAASLLYNAIRMHHEQVDKTTLLSSVWEEERHED